MRFRFGWALVLLAAVFSMHGLQCAAAEPPPSTSSVADQGAATHDGHGTTSTATVDAVPTADLAAHDGDHHPAGHSSTVHALMVCLAVLAGGVGVVLAALAVWLARTRAPAVPTTVLHAVRRLPDGLRALAAPPDLARLCVLRI